MTHHCLREALAATALVGALVATSLPARADTSDRVAGSYNMQGQMQGPATPNDSLSDSRWWTAIRGLLNGLDGEAPIEVLALQEAGSAPPRSWVQTSGTNFSTPGIVEYELRMGTESRPNTAYVYWLNVGRPRISIAIVTRERAVDAVQIDVGGRFQSRPMMGVRLGTDWYFNAHALSNGAANANDAEDIIQRARTFIGARAAGHDFMVLGDFNRDPARMPPAMQANIVRADAPTHQGGSEVDWAYRAQRNNGTYEARRRAVNSDHYFVRYDLKPCRKRSEACSAGPHPGVSYNFFSAQHPDAVLTLGAMRETALLMPHAPGNADQALQVRYSALTDRYLLAFELPFGEGACITRAANDRTLLALCDPANLSQQWELRAGTIIVPGTVGYLNAAPDPLGRAPYVGSTSHAWRARELDAQSSARTGVWKRDVRTLPLRIMPLGDSITHGIESSHGGGYRAGLWDALKGDGVQNLDFVGTQRTGTLADPDHEGYPGAEIEAIARIVRQKIAQFRPNVVTLHIGTNDLNNRRASGAVTRLSQLVDLLFSEDPDVTLLLATLVPANDSVTQRSIEDYNRALSSLVAERRAQGRRILLVNMGAVAHTDLADGLHPNDQGYAKMARAFHLGLIMAENDGWIAPLATGAATGCSDAPNRWLSRGRIAAGVGAPRANVHFADIDGDGRDDYLVVHPGSGAVDAWRNLGGDDARGAGWAPMGRIAPGVFPAPDDVITFADIDGDRRDDYLVVTAETGAVRAWLNRVGAADGQRWNQRGQIASGVGSVGSLVRFADVDGDGRDDYLIVNPSSGAVHAWLNTGGDSAIGAGWVPRGQIASGLGGYRVALANVDCNARDDYLVLHDGAVDAWLNVGGDTAAGPGWVARGRIAAGVGADPDGLRFADMDGDGRDDYLIVGNDGSVEAWLNRGGDPR
ncbi:MAG: GDSL-type esterase/lipase family protein [Polyangiales bacterium]